MIKGWQLCLVTIILPWMFICMQKFTIQPLIQDLLLTCKYWLIVTSDHIHPKGEHHSFPILHLVIYNLYILDGIVANARNRKLALHIKTVRKIKVISKVNVQYTEFSKK